VGAHVYNMTREQMAAHIILVMLAYCDGSGGKEMSLLLNSEDNS
jgi:hypothetical protein